LTSVHSFVGDECLGDVLVSVWMTESDLGERSTTARVVNDLLHDTTNITMSLSVVEGAELGRGFVETGVGRYSDKGSRQYVNYLVYS
jgi:hypothetical protein